MTDTPATVAERLASILAQLQTLHEDAEAAHLPQGVIMGLHWLCEDASGTLAHLRGMMNTNKEPIT